MPPPRKLGRTPKHRAALFRNLVTALFEHESITTTHAKAKETQRIADKLISLTKKQDKELAIRLAQPEIFKHGEILPKLFGEIKDRYEGRFRGFTRVLKLEPRLSDSAPQSIVELVDGGREMKFWMLARVVARCEQQGLPVDSLTKSNVDKAIKFKPQGEQVFRDLVERMKTEFYADVKKLENNKPTLTPETPVRSPYGKRSTKKFNFLERPARE